MDHLEILDLRASRTIMLLYAYGSSFEGHVQWISAQRFTESLRRYSIILQLLTLRVGDCWLLAKLDVMDN